VDKFIVSSAEHDVVYPCGTHVIKLTFTMHDL